MATPVLDGASVTEFRSSFRGVLVETGDAAYDI